MKLNLLFINICLIYSIHSDAQGTFQKTYNNSNSDLGYSLISDSTGFIIAGTSNYGQGGKDVLIMKTDLSGNFMWGKTIGGIGDEEAKSIKRTSDGGFIIAGYTTSYLSASIDSSNAYIVKTDNNGDILWKISFGSYASEKAYDVIETYDYKYIIAGTTNSYGPGNGDILLFSLDNSGNLLWSYGIGSNGTDIAYSLVQDDNHDLIIAGSTTAFNNNGEIPYLIRTSALGSILYSRTFDLGTSPIVSKTFFSKIIKGYANDYILSGSVGIGSIGDAQHFVLNSGQTFISYNWAKKYTMNSGASGATSLDKTSDGRIIIGGHMSNLPALIKIDPVGQLEYHKFYINLSSGYQGRGLDVKATTDGGIIMVGYRNNSSDTSVHLIKTNLSISSACSTTNGFNFLPVNLTPTLTPQTATSGTGTNILINDSGIVVNIIPFTNVLCTTTEVNDFEEPNIVLFPNPTNNKITIKNLIDQQDISFFIKSIYGFNLMNFDYKRINKSEFEIDLTDLSCGIYLLEIVTSNGRIVRKIIKY